MSTTPTTTSVIRIRSGDLVPETGYYRYIEHVKPNECRDCTVMPSEKRGTYLVSGIHAPNLVACEHDVKWEKLLA